MQRRREPRQRRPVITNPHIGNAIGRNKILFGQLHKGCRSDHGYSPRCTRHWNEAVSIIAKTGDGHKERARCHLAAVGTNLSDYWIMLKHRHVETGLLE